jgi:transposase
LPGFAEPHARTTVRLRQAHESIGYALGGEPGSRLTMDLSMATSPDTLLRRVKQLKDAGAPPPRFVGIDDWAWCKGQRYGTVVVDLERSVVVDLLPDREPNTVKVWLNEHPGVELISRDRWSDYAKASAEAAPQAQQVADRWHLLKNLREAIERLFERNSTVIAEALKAAETPSEPVSNPITTEAGSRKAVAEPSCPEPSSAAGPKSVELELPEQADGPSALPPSKPAAESSRRGVQRLRRQRRVERFEQVHERHKLGHSERRIARELGLSRKTVRRYLRSETCPDWSSGRRQRSHVEAHREWIDARLAEGVTNVVELHRQLTERGFQGSYGSVWRYVTKRLGAAGKKGERINAAKPPVPVPPTAKQLSFAWVRRPEKRKPLEESRVAAIRAASDDLAAALDLADEFAALIRKHAQTTLSDWLVKGEASSVPELRRFAEGIRRDEAAVLAAVTQRWSNGPVEGHINRLKTVKRQMYGRAGFVLLRARVVHAH